MLKAGSKGFGDEVSIKVLKSNLRKRIRTKLKELNESELESQGLKVFERLMSFETFKSSKSLSCYKSMNLNEMRTDLIISQSLRNNKKVFLPYCPINKQDEDDRMRMLRLMDLVSFDRLKSSSSINTTTGSFHPTTKKKLNIDQFDQEEAKTLEDGLAFDRYGNRLGHGRGYYDRFLSEYFEKFKSNSVERREDGAIVSRSGGSECNGRPRLIGLSLREQVLPLDEVIPTDRNDHPIDILISPDGIFYPLKQPFKSSDS
ncbi:expressed protein [Phakopsora pachyrhizi]|uniref:5-formyltetrahydrofolate cyclo-ligase n=1 Tax=Phakopsora pachyrhizi TaxID=170000 RepID=A0AAV0AID4_PHAPC|nr:expressed protein [Phakopsora pachyrhizi]